MIGKNFREATRGTKSTKESGVAGGAREERGQQHKERTRIVRQFRQFPTIDFNIENYENRFADIEKRERSGWNAGVWAARTRGGGKAENKRKGQCFP